MKIKTKALFLGICLLAQATFAAETIASFVKQILAFDLATVSFGTTNQTNDEYKPAGSPLSMPAMTTPTNVLWMTNTVSAKYHQDFPNRILRYGFLEGRLVSLRISIDSIKAMVSDQELFKQQHKELIQIQDEYIKTGPSRRFNQDDTTFQIHSGVMCGSGDSLFIAEFEITPLEKKPSR